MGERGPTPWYEKIDAELRQTIDDALDAGEETPRELHTRLDLEAVISWQNFNKYAATRRDAIPHENVVAVGDLVQALRADYPDLTQTEQTLLTLMVERLVTAKKASTVAGGLRALTDLMRVRIERRKDLRADEVHRARMRELQSKIKDAARAEEGTGKQVVDLATVARLMSEVDQAA